MLKSESEGSQFKPHYQDIKKKVYPGAVSSKLGNSKTHKNCLFEIKKFLMQIIILWEIWHHQETLFSVTQVHTASDPVVETWAKSLSEFNTKYPAGINSFSIHANHVLRS